MYIDSPDLFTTVSDTTHMSVLFSVEVIDGNPAGLYLDRDFCMLMGYDPTTPPAQLMHEMFSGVYEDDKQGILAILGNCTAGVKMEIQFRSLKM